MYTYSYFPGCSLHGTAKEYDHSLRLVAGKLGVELQELEDWSCCGATAAHSTDELLALALPARNLRLAGFSSWCCVTRMRLKHMTHGARSGRPVMAARSRLSAGRARASNSSVLCAAVAPQQLQSSSSCSSTPSLPATRRSEWSYSLAVPWSEQPGK